MKHTFKSWLIANIESIVMVITFASLLLLYLKFEDINIFKVLYPLFCVIGAVCETSVAWRISAFFNGMMLIINLASIIFLNDNVFKKREIMYDKEKD